MTMELCNFSESRLYPLLGRVALGIRSGEACYHSDTIVIEDNFRMNIIVKIVTKNTICKTYILILMVEEFCGIVGLLTGWIFVSRS